MKRQPETQEEVAGNSVASAAGLSRILERVGMALTDAERSFEVQFDRDVAVTSIKVLLPTYERADYLVVCNAEREGERLVAFHGGASFQEAVVGTLHKFRNNSMKWRADTWSNDG